MRSDRIESTGGGASRGTGSVKVIKPDPFRVARNSAETINVNTRKSGLMARLRAQDVKQSKPAKVIKIDSNPSPKGTQTGHAVTDNNNHTRTVK